jgi:hypothetical protein
VDLAIVGRAIDLRGESPVLAPREMVALEDCLLSEHGTAPAADDLLGRRLRVLHLCGLHQRHEMRRDGAAGGHEAMEGGHSAAGEAVTVGGVAAAARTLLCDIHGRLPLLPPHRVPPLPADPAERSGRLRPGHKEKLGIQRMTVAPGPPLQLKNSLLFPDP